MPQALFGKPKSEDPSIVSAFAATAIWVNCWMFVPFVGFGSIWIKFGFLYACGWWTSLGLLLPKMPQKESVRWFMWGIKHWIDGAEVVGNIKAEVASDGKPVMTCHHPHGAVAVNSAAFGALTMDASAVAAPPVFKMPVCRQMMELMGAISSDKKTFVKHMQSRKHLAILPGGIDEVCLADQTKERIYIKHRQGFVKYALQYGYDLIPIYHLGETFLYDALWPMTEDPIVKIRMWIAQKTGVALCAGIGCRWMWNLPKRGQKCVSVVGERLVLPKIDDPTKEDVQKYHQLYVDALVDLYNKNRYRVPGYENRELHLW